MRTSIMRSVILALLCPTSFASIDKFIRHTGSGSQAQSIPLKNELKIYTQKCICPHEEKSLIDCHKKDLSFGIADIKYDTNSLKILELGEGTTSMFTGYENIYGQGSMWEKIWSFLIQQIKSLTQDFSPHIFFIDQDLYTAPNQKVLALGQLMQRGDVAVEHHEALFDHETFIKSQQLSTLAQSPHGLLIIRHFSAQEQWIQKLYTQTNGLLLCNEAIAPFVNNKKFTDALFFGPLRIYRPYTKIITKKNALATAKEALCESASKNFVIKPLSACKGNGIIFTARNNLTTELKKLFGPQQRGPQSLSPAERYWQDDVENEFIVESCETSKPTTVQGRQFDGTLRLVYGLTHAYGTVTTTLLGCYWKLPQKPITAQCPPDEKKLSHISGKTQSSAPVSCEDYEAISEQFLPLMTALYNQMIIQKGLLPCC